LCRTSVSFYGDVTDSAAFPLLANCVIWRGFYSRKQIFGEPKNKTVMLNIYPVSEDQIYVASYLVIHGSKDQFYVASSRSRNIKLQTGFFVSNCWFINDYILLLKGRHKLQ